MRLLASVIVVVCFVSISGWAGEPIVIGETVTLQSKIMKEERTILVSTPPGYIQTADRYPVLYLTDGEMHVTHTRGTVDFLARNGLIPQLIIVGVANTDRTRDLTPTHVESQEQGGQVYELPTSGGGGTFLDFFEHELFDHIDSKYRTLPLRFFSGHSFGGLFAINAIFDRPEMFAGAIAVSPSLRWDDDQPIRLAREYFEENDALEVDLFVAMANEEVGVEPPTGLERLEEVLSSSKADGLRFSVKRMPDETHGSVVLRAHYWGLREIFAGWALARDPRTGMFEGGVGELKKHYQGLAKRYGIAFTPPEATVNLVGYQFLQNGEVDTALSFFILNTVLHPNSANVYDSLGEGLENAGRFDEAVMAYTSAVEHAGINGDPRIGLFTTNLDRAKAATTKQEK